MKALVLFPVLCGAILAGCTRIAPLDADRLAAPDAVILVMTHDRQMYRLTGFHFRSYDLAGSGEHLLGSFAYAEPFSGSVPYSQIEFVGCEERDAGPWLYYGIWLTVFIGFVVLLSRIDAVRHRSTGGLAPAASAGGKA